MTTKHETTLKIVNTFTELLRESTLLQATITLAVILTICYLYINEKTPAPELWNVATLIIGFYFGSKSNRMAAKTIEAMKDKECL